MEEVVRFQWSAQANETISYVAQTQQGLAQQIRTNVQQWAQNNAGNWHVNNQYSHSFRTGGYAYRAEYKLLAGNVVQIVRVEMD